MTSCLNQDSLPQILPHHQPSFSSLLFPPEVSPVPGLVHLLNKCLVGVRSALAPTILGTENSGMNKHT